MDHRIQQVHQRTLLPNSADGVRTKQTGTSFHDALKQVQDSSLKVSKHAQARLSERNIEISKEKWQEISTQVAKAKQKGITDSLVVTDEATLLVSTKNNTVVTAMDRQEAKSRIFTNINGTIVVD